MGPEAIERAINYHQLRLNRTLHVVVTLLERTGSCCPTPATDRVGGALAALQQINQRPATPSFTPGMVQNTFVASGSEARGGRFKWGGCRNRSGAALQGGRSGALNLL